MRVGINLLFWKPKGAGGIETMLRSFIGSMSEHLHEFPAIELYLLGTVENLKEFSGINPAIQLIPVCSSIQSIQDRLWKEQISLRTTAKRLQLDLVHTMNYYGPLFLHCPSMVSILDMNYRAVPETFKGSTRIGRSILTVLSSKRAHTIMTISDFSKSEIEHYISPRAPIIPIQLAPSPELFRVTAEWPDSVPQNESYLFSLGSSFLHKNFHGLIAAYNTYCQIVSESGEEPAYLYIAGVARSGNKALLDAVENSVNYKRIRLLGPVSNEKLKALYQHAFGFVFPSLYEGFGLPPLEAMALGCPVVCSNAASLPEVVGDAALLGNAREPNTFGELISRLHDTDTRQKLISAGYERAILYSWEKAARKLLRTYLSLDF